MSPLRFYEHKRFPRALAELRKKGAGYQRAALEIDALLGRIVRAADHSADALEGMRLTKHGESRIRNCVKYDLTQFARLVTVQTDGYCILLYCADHEDCDRWIEEHKGMQFVVDGSSRVVETYHSPTDDEGSRVGGKGGLNLRPLYLSLDEELYDELMVGVAPRVIRQLEGYDATVREAELWETLAPVVSPERRLLVYDVFAQLRADRVPQAVARIHEFLGLAIPLEEVQSSELPETIDSDVLRSIDPTSPRYGEALKRFMQAATYHDWMLFMHPDQQRIVDEDFSGPAKLVGVSGSGKTCVVVRRAIRLAEQSNGQVLVLTLNRALAQLIDELMTACASDAVRSRIFVKPFFVLCQELMLEINPEGERIYREVTWKSGEHVDEIWQEYYRCGTNNFHARVLSPVHDSLLGRGCNPERYLREEIDWIRSALFPDARNRYLTIERLGRKVHLSRPFKELILDGAKGWEEKMEVVGVMDALGLAQALVQELPYVSARYQSVLVDEFQDFGNIELEIVRALVTPGENDIFLCGDAAQAVTTKYQRLREIGISIPGARSRTLRQNYRNTRDILQAAYAVLVGNLSEDLIDREDLDVLDPELSPVNGPVPLLLEAGNLAEELAHAFALANEKSAVEPQAKICIAICGYTLHELTVYGRRMGVPVLDGSTSLGDGGIFLSDLAQTKGFEFDLVCIVNCSRGVLPDSAAPEEEQHRDSAMLYVAMTRAKMDLVVSWNGGVSPLLSGTDSQFYGASWTEYLPGRSVPAVPVPRQIDYFRDQHEPRGWKDMTGEEFLYSEHAVGLSLDLIAKIRTLVDGKGLRKGSQLVKWRRLGQAVDDYHLNPQIRQLWGPEVGRQLVELAARLADHETVDQLKTIAAVKLSERPASDCVDAQFQ